MTAPKLKDFARSPVAVGKDLLAIDESDPTCDKRFAAEVDRFPLPTRAE